MLHNLSFLFASLALIIAQLIFACRFFSQGLAGMVAFSAGVAVLTPVLVVLAQALPAVSGFILFGLGLVVDLWIVLLPAASSRV